MRDWREKRDSKFGIQGPKFRELRTQNSELRTSDPARLPLLVRFKLRTQHAELRTGFIPGEYHDCPPESSLLGVCPSHPSLRGVRNSSLVNCERDKLDVRDRHDPKFEVPKTSNLEPRTFARPAFLACRASPARITRYDSRFTRAENDADACGSFAAVEWCYPDRLLRCYQELTLPTLTGQGCLIMVSEVLTPLAPPFDLGIAVWLMCYVHTTGAETFQQISS